MTFLDERDDGLVGRIRQNGSGGFRGVGGFFAVADAVDGGNENATGLAAKHVAIAGSAFAGKREVGNAVFNEWRVYSFHFVTVTMVPRPSCELMSKSSIRRRTPGRPMPRLPEVEKPSRKASLRSEMPGPSSEATTRRPWRRES